MPRLVNPEMWAFAIHPPTTPLPHPYHTPRPTADILESLESKICFLCELNPVAVASRCFMIVVMLLLVLLGLGGMLAVGDGWGFMACAAFPFALVQSAPLFAQFRNGALQLHLETRSHLGLSSPSA